MNLKKEPFVIGIVPARGGSKRLPGKNIRPLCGKPLIHYVISAGQNSTSLNRLIVSTDCEEIKKVAEECGGDVPFLRPSELAQDTSSSEDAIKHAVLFVEQQEGKQVDIVVLLQPTQPFTTVGMIDGCVELLQKENRDAVITVAPVHCRAEWIGLLDKSNTFRQIIPEKDYFELAGQKEYAPSGNVYAFTRERLFEGKKIIGGNTGVYVVPVENAVDIDYLLDFQFAEFLLERNLVSR